MKILQFGEGNFLRAFFDWMIDVANEQGVTSAEVTIVPPRFHNNRGIEALKEQGGAYHVMLEGVADGEARQEVRRITCVKRAFAPEDEPEAYEQTILDPDLRLIVSNTTEAGIVYQPEKVSASPLEGTGGGASTFPGKIAALLYRRFKHFDGAKDKGLIIIACELIEDNGQRLKEIVLRHAEENNLGAEFVAWLNEACIFCDSLVDRIVAGYPQDLEGYSDELKADRLLVKGELYHLWVIGTPQWEQVQRELPLHKAGLHVEFMESCREFREKKVRVLNGCHTAMTPVSLLLGLETVREAFTHPLVRQYIDQMVEHEVLPMIPGDRETLRAFADGILERFLNPYIRHQLTSIALNSISKWKARLWPTVKDVHDKTGRLATHSIFAYAALRALYAQEGFTPQDSDIEQADSFAMRYEQEAPGFKALVEQYIDSITHGGIEAALRSVISA